MPQRQTQVKRVSSILPSLWLLVFLVATTTITNITMRFPALLVAPASARQRAKNHIVPTTWLPQVQALSFHASPQNRMAGKRSPYPSSSSTLMQLHSNTLLRAYSNTNGNDNIGGNNNSNQPPRGLTSDDLTGDSLGAADRSLYMSAPKSFSGGYDEEDIDVMAANYIPEDESDGSVEPEQIMGGDSSGDDNMMTQTSPSIPVESEGGDDEMLQRPPSQPPIPSSYSNHQTVPTKQKEPQEEEEDLSEPLSPLSFSSQFAEPTHLLDEPEPTRPRTTSSSRSSRPTNPSLPHDFWGDSDTDVEDDAPQSISTSSPPAKRASYSTPSNSADGSSYTGSPDEGLSTEAFRAKYTFSEEEVNFPSMMEQPRSTTTTTTTSTGNEGTNSMHMNRSDQKQQQQSGTSNTAIYRLPAVESTRRDDEMYQLETTLERLEKEIFTLNQGIQFNLGSYKQVALVLFGSPDESTSKAVLEGMAASNVMARLILEHRQSKQRLTKLQKQIENAPRRRKPQMYGAPYDASSVTGKKELSMADLPDPLLLVDTSSFIFRAYYSMPPMHRSDGLPTSAVLGFCNMLNRMVMTPLLAGLQPRVVLCCDAQGKNFRHERYPDYKANRKEAPMDLIPQFGLIREAAKAYGMLWIEAPGYEADDVIASLAQKALAEGLEVQIYSGDKDLMQLVTNRTTAIGDDGTPKGKIEMVDPMTQVLWDHDGVVEKWGVASHQLGDVLALAGDSADNIPGVPGIGPKIAAKLLQEFDTLENLLKNLDQIPQKKRREKLETFQELAILSQELVRLESDLDWDVMEIDPNNVLETDAPERVADLRMEAMDPDRLIGFYEEMGFVTIKQRLVERLRRPSTRLQSNQIGKAASSPQTPSSGENPKKKKSYPPRTKTAVPKPEDYQDVPF